MSVRAAVHLELLLLAFCRLSRALALSSLSLWSSGGGDISSDLLLCLCLW